MKSIVIYFILLIIYLVVFRKRECFTITNCDDIEILYQMLYDIDKILVNNDLLYYIDGGTLLGAVRHKGIIPWDDDGDICIFEEDENNFLNLKDEFLKLGYDIIDYWGGYKIYPVNGKNIKYENANWFWGYGADVKDVDIPKHKFPFVDVTLVKNINNVVHYTNQTMKDNYNKCFNLNSDLNNLKNYEFNGFTLKGPNNPIPYLDSCYGKDWNTVGKQLYDHLNMQFMNNSITDSEKLYLPACQKFKIKK
jgi:phosphorylcholine metabolism protein LicD